MLTCLHRLRSSLWKLFVVHTLDANIFRIMWMIYENGGMWCQTGWQVGFKPIHSLYTLFQVREIGQRLRHLPGMWPTLDQIPGTACGPLNQEWSLNMVQPSLQTPFVPQFGPSLFIKGLCVESSFLFLTSKQATSRAILLTLALIVIVLVCAQHWVLRVSVQCPFYSRKVWLF